MAPGAGQAARQPGSEQCMHWSLRISHCSAPLSSCSRNLIRFQKFADMSGIVWYVPICTVVSGGRSFHSWQATSQALQPMQVEVSISLATTGTLRTPGAGGVLADTRRSSRVATLHLLQPDQET